MSQIDDILAAIAALTPTVGSITPTVWTPDIVHLSAEAADLPVRIVSPFDGAGASFVQFSTAQGNRTAEWTITDLLLWREAGTGRGPIDVGQTLYRYLAAYLESLDSLRATQWRLTGAQFRSGVVVWPAGTDRQYDGATVTLTIRELLGG